MKGNSSWLQLLKEAVFKPCSGLEGRDIVGIAVSVMQQRKGATWLYCSGSGRRDVPGVLAHVKQELELGT